MRFTSLALVFCTCAFTFAQEKIPNLTQLLDSQTNLTNFTNLLTTYGADIYANLSTQQNITIFAPSDLAFSKIQSQVLGPAFATNNTDVLRTLIQYHITPGTHPSNTFNGSFQFPPTLLNNQTYSNVTGGQVVALVQQAGNISVAVTGLGSRSTLTMTDLAFNNGILHIVDTVFIPPVDFTFSAPQFNLSSASGAVTAASLSNTIDTARDVTIFAPNNQALQNIGSTLSSLSSDDLTHLLKYHVVVSNSTVYYSSNLPNGIKYPNGTTLTSLEGTKLQITFVDNSIFVNSARVIQQDLLLSNGVLHIIDNVLSVNSTAAKPNSTLATQAPVISGTSLEGNILPFTTALPTSTSVLFSQASAAATSTVAGGPMAGGRGTATTTTTGSGNAQATSTKKASGRRVEMVHSMGIFLGAIGVGLLGLI